MFAWLERRIDPFAPFDDERMPPRSILGFSWVYLKPIRFWLVLIFFSNCLIGGLESALFFLIGWFVDLLDRGTPPEVWSPSTEPSPRRWRRSSSWSCGRSCTSCTRASSTRSLVPQTTNMIRWRTHALHARPCARLFPEPISPGASRTASRRRPGDPRDRGRGPRHGSGTSRSSPSRRSALFSRDQPLAGAAHGRAGSSPMWRCCAIFVPRAQERSRSKSPIPARPSSAASSTATPTS